MSDRILLPHGELQFPVFLPDATMGVVRSLDAEDLVQAGVPALVMNVFHLMQKPGSSTIAALGGLHKMSGWNRPIMTDSGGFQAYSLIRQNAKFGRISDAGLRFKPEGAEREFQLTPEKCVQLQLSYGADIVVCLDDCTHTDDPATEQEKSVTRTIRWGARCRKEFDHQLRSRRIELDDPARPKLFGVIQGGGSEELRRHCAEALLEVGFDGFGFGGWPLDGHGKLLESILRYTRALIPPELPMHALGIGQPESVAACHAMGYQMFDCALPTRDARTGRLYAWTRDPEGPMALQTEGWRDVVYIDDEKFTKLDGPVSPWCGCPTCTRYSVGYLRHLHKCGETLYFRLATRHNLHFMAQLMDALRRPAPEPIDPDDE